MALPFQTMDYGEDATSDDVTALQNLTEWMNSPQFFSAYFAGSTSDSQPVNRAGAGTSTNNGASYTFNQWTTLVDTADNPNNTSSIYQVTYTGVFVITWQLGFQLQTGVGRGPVRTYLYKSEPDYSTTTTLAETRDILPGMNAGTWGFAEFLTTSGTTLCKLNVGDRLSVGFTLDDSAINLHRSGCRWSIYQVGGVQGIGVSNNVVTFPTNGQGGGGGVDFSSFDDNHLVKAFDGDAVQSEIIHTSTPTTTTTKFLHTSGPLSLTAGTIETTQNANIASMHLSSQGIENGGITITSDGNVGIGNAVVVAGTLEVDEDISTTNSEIICNAGGNTNKGFKLTSNNGAFICGLMEERNNAGVFRVQGGVGQFDSNVHIQLDGRNGHVSGSTFGTFSDDRIKSYERPVTDALGTLALCQPKKYRKHIGHIIDGDDETPDLDGVQWVEEYGLVAQELEAVGLNHFVRNNPDDPNGIKSVSYIELVPVLIQAVKELTARLRALE